MKTLISPIFPKNLIRRLDYFADSELLEVFFVALKYLSKALSFVQESLSSNEGELGFK